MNYKVGDLVYFRANNLTSIGRIISIQRPINSKQVNIRILNQRTNLTVLNPDCMWQTTEEYHALRAAKKIKLLFDNRKKGAA